MNKMQQNKPSDVLKTTSSWVLAAQTKTVKVWDDYIQKTKDEMKKQVLKQGERTVDFLTEKGLALLQDKVLTIAEGYFTWFAELEGLDTPPPTLSNQAYGAVSIYCYFNSISPSDRIFSYLFEEQDSLLKAFKLKYLTTTSGTPLFSAAQLQDLTMILPNDFAPGLPLRLDADNPQNQQGDDNHTITQGSQGAAAAPPAAAPPTPIPRDLGNIIYKVKDQLYNLIPILFVGLAESVRTNQREQTTNAKLEASLKTNKALDMAKIIKADVAAQSIMAPENMTHLVNSLVDKQFDMKGRQAQKQLTKDAVKEAQKKSLGGARVAKTPPGKHGNGGKQKGILRNASFG